MICGFSFLLSVKQNHLKSMEHKTYIYNYFHYLQKNYVISDNSQYCLKKQIIYPVCNSHTLRRAIVFIQAWVLSGFSTNQAHLMPASSLHLYIKLVHILSVYIILIHYNLHELLNYVASFFMAPFWALLCMSSFLWGSLVVLDGLLLQSTLTSFIHAWSHVT